MLEPSRPRVQRGKAARRLLLLFLVLVIIGAAGAGFVLYNVGGSGPATPVRVDIAEGSNAADVGELLVGEKVIRSSLMFRILAKLRGIGSSIQAGAYDLTTNMRVSGVLDALE